MTDHACPAKGCGKTVPFEVLACKEHWFELPVKLRKAISRSWSEGDLDEWRGYREQAVALLSGEPLAVDIRE